MPGVEDVPEGIGRGQRDRGRSDDRCIEQDDGEDRPAGVTDVVVQPPGDGTGIGEVPVQDGPAERRATTAISRAAAATVMNDPITVSARS